ncbi:flavodoxin family protein [Pseudothermotoga lettingae]|jgi:flavodoxin|uniref:Flavodoxin n=1 Tax=Pseudothermotoga lettingae (strain ATCC BAA-301 / DSM 14385 / NBRC 107922 / TMO) TaxID=416591 RepID=A8F7J7_PSELT|nr:flavodoxin domain-containing protein [Pseudothermotoga lettingae]ABV34131.1 flavodoxin [Pseudothermotoga lettingae TMO]GLI48925.1 hypothetical protein PLETTINGATMO_10940 [Pseudothermotoga lettingae TMO]
MNILILYDSFFSNTEKIARTIGEAFSPNEVNVLKVDNVKYRNLENLDLLIVGSPTRAFSPTRAIKSFLRKIPKDGLKGVKVIAFDTRFTKEKIRSSFFMLPFFVKIFGYAADSIAKKLTKKGGKLVVPSEWFFVEDVEGPLKDGEIEHTKRWVKKILKQIDFSGNQ